MCHSVRMETQSSLQTWSRASRLPHRMFAVEQQKSVWWQWMLSSLRRLCRPPLRGECLWLGTGLQPRQEMKVSLAWLHEFWPFEHFEVGEWNLGFQKQDTINTQHDMNHSYDKRDPCYDIYYNYYCLGELYLIYAEKNICMWVCRLGHKSLIDSGQISPLVTHLPLCPLLLYPYPLLFICALSFT